MLTNTDNLVIDFYAALRKVSFPENLGKAFDEEAALELVQFFDYHRLNDFVTVKPLTVEQMREWHTRWVTTEFAKADAVSGCFREVSVLVYWDLRSSTLMAKRVRDLFDLWMIFDSEIGE